MKFAQLLIAAFALGAAAAPANDASDVEVRDAAPEAATYEEFDVRAPVDDTDNVARTYRYNKCGHGAYYEHGQCVCHHGNYVYEHGKCVKKCHHSATYEHGQCTCPHGYYYHHYRGCRRH